MWQELKIQVLSDSVPLLEEKLFASGAVSLTYLDAKDQPIFLEILNETPLWESVFILSLFSETTDLEPLISELGQDRAIVNCNELKIKTLADQDWETKWMVDFQPMQFGDKLWVCPSWITPPDPSAKTIILDPGLAFGSGDHPTTSLCLSWLYDHITEEQEVMDYGCGSGVLSIAATLLGASTVYAVDYDPQAITAISNNIEKNMISEGRIRTYLPEDLPTIRVDCLVANILAMPLIELSEQFSNLTKPMGKLVLSGILEEQTNSVIQHYKRWFEIDKPQEKDGWVLISCTRKG